MTPPMRNTTQQQFPNLCLRPVNPEKRESLVVHALTSLLPELQRYEKTLSGVLR